jgi:hypothetical protein
MLQIEMDGRTHDIYVAERPFIKEFLQKVGEVYEVVIFTASLAKVSRTSFSAFARQRESRFRFSRLQPTRQCMLHSCARALACSSGVLLPRQPAVLTRSRADAAFCVFRALTALIDDSMRTLCSITLTRAKYSNIDCFVSIAHSIKATTSKTLAALGGAWRRLSS